MRSFQAVLQRTLFLTSAIVLFATGISWAAGDFASWYNTSASTRSLAVEKFINEAKQRGFVVYDEIRNEIAQLPEATAGNEKERDWINRFLTVMDRTKMPEVSAVLEDSAPDADSDRLVRKVKSFRDVFKNNPFPPREGQNDPNYHIFQDNLGVEITIAPEEASLVAQTLWRKAQMLDGLFKSDNEVLMSQTHQTIAESKQRWVNFMDNVLSDQFPWETIINGWIWEGTLAQPPQLQLRIGHPLPVMTTNVENKTTFNPRIGVEGVGIRYFTAPSFDPLWGASALAVLPGSEQEGYGYGLLLSLKTFSFGGIWQDMAQGKDRYAVVVGVDLAGLFTNGGGNKLKEKVTTIHQKLDSVENDAFSFR